MALSRWRPVAEQLGYKLRCDSSGNFILSNDSQKLNLGEREASLREFLRREQEPPQVVAVENFSGENIAPDLTDAVTDAAALAPEVSDITEKPEYKPAEPVKPISEPVDLNDALTNLVDTYNSKLSTYEDSLYEDFQSGVASLVKRFGIGRVRELAGLHSTDGTGSLTVKDFLPPEEESNLSPFEKLIAKQRAEA